ncbi:GntR family transcriptional regulator [Microbacterium sp. NPDC055910]|uniref:GntR family transcriptional regulator n=1 Tax=Microbacterium sp. NPDC055910 TaxID=3345659 RepID=UPI0035E2941A
MTDDELIALLRPDSARAGTPATQLRDALEALIDNGTLESGRRLPTERHLAETLDISRLAVRQALEALQARGAVERRQGSGTYVSSARIEGNLHLLSGLSDELSSAQRTVTTRVLQFGYCAADTAVRDALGVGPDALAVIRLVRVRSVDGIASTFETSWLPSPIAAHLLGQDLTDASLFRLLAETRGIVPDHATERLRSTVLDAQEAQQLETHAGAPAFRVNRTTYDADGAPIEYVETLLRGDRYFYATTLEAPHRLPDASERLSQFETLAVDTR